ncbi:armadillo-type protein [Bombardia bombarda]|uniref:Pumilio homology domain family member 3 n=1 Tax=Bombardia bombarda TaxID=252184 RepID=A0AA39XB79_9PEZI|nr:armadillo-type protein [Bombardia bombarda]
MPSANHSETDLHTSGTSYGELPYGELPYGELPYGGQRALHSQRPSMTGPSLSYPNQAKRAYNHGVGQQTDSEELQDVMARKLDLGDAPSGPSNGLSGMPFGNASQPFQFNPVSQPWDGQGHGPVYPTAPGYEKPNSIAGRASPAGSTYRPGLNSPKSYTGTPQPNPDLWSRPTSRGHRVAAADHDRRSSGQQFLQQQQQQQQYYTNYNYPAYQHQQYPAHLYDAYGPNPRQSVPPSTYAMPMNPFLGASGLPMRMSKDKDPANGVRSPLMEDFRMNNKSRRWELREIYGHIVEFSGDQHGSRLIQHKLECANSDEKEQVFAEIRPNILQLTKDVFGNYVIQKFFEHGNQVQKKILAAAMKGNVVNLSLQMYACRVVQKALEHVLADQQAELVKELETDILKLVRDSNGNHVVQKVIELVDRQHIGFIVDCFKGRVSELAGNSFACRVLQRVMENGTQDDRKAIMVELHKCAQHMVMDQYGNYVIQHVIKQGEDEDRLKIIRLITNQAFSFSKHKFASNVVEKCLEFGTPEQRRHIRDQVMGYGEDGTNILEAMIMDQFGNYVIQKLLKTLQGEDYRFFVKEIQPLIVSIKKKSNGRQVQAIAQLIAERSADGTPLSTAPTSPSLGSPSLRVNIGSALPTPNLTTEPNSPSSNPSSTNASAIGEIVEHANVKLNDTVDLTAGPQVHIADA